MKNLIKELNAKADLHYQLASKLQKTVENLQGITELEISLNGEKKPYHVVSIMPKKGTVAYKIMKCLKKKDNMTLDEIHKITKIGKAALSARLYRWGVFQGMGNGVWSLKSDTN